MEGEGNTTKCITAFSQPRGFDSSWSPWRHARGVGNSYGNRGPGERVDGSASSSDVGKRPRDLVPHMSLHKLRAWVDLAWIMTESQRFGC